MESLREIGPSVGGWGQAGLWPAQPPDGMPGHSVLGACPSGCDPSHPWLAPNRQAIEDLFLGSVADRCFPDRVPRVGGDRSLR